MKNAKKAGGFAFPAKVLVKQYVSKEDALMLVGEDGMTLRDYFAAQIAGGDAASGTGWTVCTPRDSDDIDLHEQSVAVRERAKFYYKIADAMLEARK